MDLSSRYTPLVPVSLFFSIFQIKLHSCCKTSPRVQVSVALPTRQARYTFFLSLFLSFCVCVFQVLSQEMCVQCVFARVCSRGPGWRPEGSAGFRTTWRPLMSLNCDYTAITADWGQMSCGIEKAWSVGIIHTNTEETDKKKVVGEMENLRFKKIG